MSQCMLCARSKSNYEGTTQVEELNTDIYFVSSNQAHPNYINYFNYKMYFLTS